MTQAVWCSPLLPLLDPTAAIATKSGAMAHPIGCGERFKVDFLRYLKAYGKRIFSLTTQLMDYDFSAIRAAFIGSAPSRQKPASSRPSEQTSFGWLGLQEVLSTVPIQAQNDETSLPSHVIVQVSSIATLGAAPTWLTQFQSVLAHSAVKEPTPTKSSSSFFAKRDTSSTQQDKASTPKFNVIFPTPEEIRTSLDGWASGGSIHMKLQSQQQQKQLEYMHPLFCHWKSPSAKSHVTSKALQRGEALRGPAAPHIKTYIRFSTLEHKTIDWAMVTSANLSKQAWGDVVNKDDEIWIQSWEAGVVVWPALFVEPDAAKEVVMVPVFAKDMPGPEDLCDAVEGSEVEDEVDSDRTVVGFRMPYDLPLSPYAANDKPWCATMQYSEPDWKGLAWGGY
jgi:tyrosyl-DNA phosphodiesterase-1